MIFVAGSSGVQPPIWNTENEHGWQVSQLASMAATFIGWTCVIDQAELAADLHLQDRRHEQHPDADLGRAVEQRHVAAAAQVPGGDRQHHRAAVEQRRHDHVHVRRAGTPGW